MSRILLIMLIFCLAGAICNIPDANTAAAETNLLQAVPQDSNIDICKNMFVFQSYLKLVLEDFLTEKIDTVVITNSTFYDYLAKEKNLVNKKGKFKDESQEKIYFKKYLEFMKNSTGKTIIINLELFNKYMYDKKNKRSGYIVNGVLDFRKLGVTDHNEFINKYFVVNNGAGCLKREFTPNPSFIGFLLDLGYDVRRDCFSDELHISPIPIKY